VAHFSRPLREVELLSVSSSLEPRFCAVSELNAYPAGCLREPPPPTFPPKNASEVRLPRWWSRCWAQAPGAWAPAKK